MCSPEQYYILMSDSVKEQIEETSNARKKRRIEYPQPIIPDNPEFKKPKKKPKKKQQQKQVEKSTTEQLSWDDGYVKCVCDMVNIQLGNKPFNPNPKDWKKFMKSIGYG